jgi:hypothetical protein
MYIQNALRSEDNTLIMHNETDITDKTYFSVKKNGISWDTGKCKRLFAKYMAFF